MSNKHLEKKKLIVESLYGDFYDFFTKDDIIFTSIM
jgi:hypothetical protein